MTSRRRARRPLRLLGLIPALAWLLSQLAMTGVFAEAWAGSGAVDAASPSAVEIGPGGQETVICTPEGLKVLRLGPDGAPDGGPDGGPESDQEGGGAAGVFYADCLLCKTLGAAALPGRSGLAEPLDFPGSEEGYPGRADPAPGRGAVLAGFSSRAPPL